MMHPEIELRGESCILLSVLCLVLPMNWVFAALTAAMLHEICHVLAVYLLGGTIQRLKIGAGEAVLESSMLLPWQELTAILAGPLGSLSLMFLRTQWPKLALCGLVQGLFNLLPVFPLDGGRALACICRILFTPETAEQVCRAARIITGLAVAVLGLWGCLGAKLGMAPLIFAVLLLLKASHVKKSCKEGILRVQ